MPVATPQQIDEAKRYWETQGGASVAPSPSPAPPAGGPAPAATAPRTGVESGQPAVAPAPVSPDRALFDRYRAAVLAHQAPPPPPTPGGLLQGLRLFQAQELENQRMQSEQKRLELEQKRYGVAERAQAMKEEDRRKRETSPIYQTLHRELGLPIDQSMQQLVNAEEKQWLGTRADIRKSDAMAAELMNHIVAMGKQNDRDYSAATLRWMAQPFDVARKNFFSPDVQTIVNQLSQLEAVTAPTYLKRTRLGQTALEWFRAHLPHPGDTFQTMYRSAADLRKFLHLMETLGNPFNFEPVDAYVRETLKTPVSFPYTDESRSHVDENRLVNGQVYRGPDGTLYEAIVKRGETDDPATLGKLLKPPQMKVLGKATPTGAKSK